MIVVTIGVMITVVMAVFMKEKGAIFQYIDSSSDRVVMTYSLITHFPSMVYLILLLHNHVFNFISTLLPRFITYLIIYLIIY